MTKWCALKPIWAFAVMALVLAGCAQPTTKTELIPKPSIEDHVFNAPSEKAYFEYQVDTDYAEYKSVFNQSNDPYRLGILASEIAMYSGNTEWSAVAQSYLSRATVPVGNTAVLDAYKGLAYALQARDYPLRGAAMLIPGPGYQRLYFVDQARSKLDSAADARPDDTIIRFIRAIVYTNFPEIFGTREIGLKDYEILMAQIEQPTNTGMRSPSNFQKEVFAGYGLALDRNGKAKQAKSVWNSILEQFPNTPEAALGAGKLYGK